MAKTRNTLAAPVFKRVTASTNNENDRGYHHCFEQRDDITLTFDVETDASVTTINFVLWDLEDSVNPKVRHYEDSPVNTGKAKITIKHPSDEHLGPGPYCAALTASSSAASSSTSSAGGKIVGNALYYYETWEDIRDCRYH